MQSTASESLKKVVETKTSMNAVKNYRMSCFNRTCWNDISQQAIPRALRVRWAFSISLNGSFVSSCIQYVYIVFTCGCPSAARQLSPAKSDLYLMRADHRVIIFPLTWAAGVTSTHKAVEGHALVSIGARWLFQVCIPRRLGRPMQGD